MNNQGTPVSANIAEVPQHIGERLHEMQKAGMPLENALFYLAFERGHIHTAPSGTIVDLLPGKLSTNDTNIAPSAGWTQSVLGILWFALVKQWDHSAKRWFHHGIGVAFAFLISFFIMAMAKLTRQELGPFQTLEHYIQLGAGGLFGAEVLLSLLWSIIEQQVEYLKQCIYKWKRPLAGEAVESVQQPQPLRDGQTAVQTTSSPPPQAQDASATTVEIRGTNATMDPLFGQRDRAPHLGEFSSADTPHHEQTLQQGDER